MSRLTKRQQAVIDAISNESETCSRDERESMIPEIRAYRNADIYCDGADHGITGEQFRATMRRMFHGIEIAAEEIG